MAQGERPTHVINSIEEGRDKAYWREVGCGWLNRDGSITLKLYMLPFLKLNVKERPQNESEEPRVR